MSYRGGAPWSLILLLGVLAPHARAAAPDEKQNEARARFEAGLADVELGDLRAALSEFEAAYAAQPNFSVLYNIGRARAGLGEPLAAIVAFERYLSEGGARVPAQRAVEVRGLVDACRQRLGTLKIVVTQPNDTRVWLDGSELGDDDLSHPMQLTVGAHQLLYSTRGSAPMSERFEILPRSVREITLAPPPREPGVGAIQVVCDVPAVDVVLENERRGQTPLPRAIVWPAGDVRVAFSRAGYVPTELRLQVRANATTIVDCAQRNDPKSSAALEGRLRLRLEPTDAEGFVDGKRFSGATLPPGPHHLAVVRSGYAPLSQRIELRAGQTLDHFARLEPMPAEVARMRSARSRRQSISYLLFGAGATLLATSAAVYAWNSGRYRDWQANPQQGLDRAVSIQRFDDLALGLLVGGVGFGTGGAWLYFSSSSDAP